jgi:Protein of unknown function (DUF3099)
MARHPVPRPSPARHPTGEAVRITTAATSRAEDIAARQKRYVLAMSFRTACFVAAIVVTITWVRVLLIVGALVLPYVAVVMANAGSSKSDGFALVDGAGTSRELPSGTESDTDSGPDHL